MNHKCKFQVKNIKIMNNKLFKLEMKHKIKLMN